MEKQIVIKDGRGEAFKELAKVNKKTVAAWFRNNPNKTMKECSDAIGLCYSTTRKWALTLQKEQAARAAKK